MMNARTVLLTFPPDIDVNPNPTGFHDMLMGGGSPFYNDLIVDLKLNISLVLATSMGRCTYDKATSNASCDGIVGKLASGAGDFTLMPLGLTLYDPGIKDIPVRFGPEMYEAGWIFASLPYEEAHQKRITVSYTLHEIPLYYCLTFLFYVISYLLLNYSVTRGKFLLRVKMIQMYGVGLMRPTGRVQRMYRRFIYWLCLCLSAMTYQVLMGSTSSDMVVVIPPKYYETYHEIAASNETPTLLAGLSLDDNFVESVHDRDKQVIYRRAMARQTRLSAGQSNVWMTMASKIRNTVQFFDNEMEAMTVLGLSCYQNDFKPPPGLKDSKVFDYSVAIMVHSQYIRPILRKHVSHFYQRLLEAGFYDKYQTDVRVSLSALGDLDRLTLCMIRVATNHTTQDSAKVCPRNLSYYDDFLIFSSIMIVVSLIAIALECFEKQKRLCEERKDWTLVKGQTLVLK